MMPGDARVQACRATKVSSEQSEAVLARALRLTGAADLDPRGLAEAALADLQERTDDALAERRRQEIEFWLDTHFER
jgi:hypothetical protein